jgi:hypothetical protein
MSSIYDQYHSDKNINHLYNYMNTILEKKTDISILQNIEYFNYFSNFLREHFLNSEKTTLQELNHELIQITLVEIYTKIVISKKKEESNNSPMVIIKEEDNIENLKNNTNKIDNSEILEKFNSIMIDRKIPQAIDTNIQVKENNNPNEVDENIQVKENDTNIQVKENDTNIQVKENDTNIQQNKIMYSSFNRIKEQNSTRFNYKINNQFKQISKFTKLIIPIEKILLFTSPIIKLNISELDLDILLSLNKTYSLSGYNYGEYIPLETININKNPDRLSVKINNIYENIEYENDILNGIYDKNQNRIDLEIVDINQDDIINISNDKNINIFTEVDITPSTSGLIMNNSDIDDKEKLDIINMNLQNIIIFN